MSIKKIFIYILSVIFIGILFFVFIYNQFIKPPKNFPESYSLSIQTGQNLIDISKTLYENNIIRSSRVFEILMISFGDEKKISQGEYLFSEPLSVFDVVFKIVGRNFGIDRERITFPEGFSNIEMSLRIQEKIPSFDTQKFLDMTEGDQGYLFPDTYLFFPSVSVEHVVETLKQNFKRKTSDLEDKVLASGKTWNEILTMASIIEKEAFGKNDRYIISGILWKRIEIGMPLQVDAPFIYLLGKESKDLTMKDLSMESPFNTYRNKGLPPSPINNPGIDAIGAALNPQKSEYLFYLHDTDGNIHYASNYKEHQENIKKYLRK